MEGTHSGSWHKPCESKTNPGSHPPTSHGFKRSPPQSVVVVVELVVVVVDVMEVVVVEVVLVEVVVEVAGIGIKSCSITGSSALASTATE